MDGKPVIFYSMAEDEQGLRQLGLFAESLRKFGGIYSGSEIRIYQPPGSLGARAVCWPENVSILEIPDMAEECRSYFFANKVYCAADAEAELAREKAVLVWVDEDTVILNNPEACALKPGKAAALCPVMHNRTGVEWGRSPGALWSFLDAEFEIDPESLGPLTTPADEARIRPYYNAGFMIVDPERNLMRDWKDRFVPLCKNPKVQDMVAQKPDDRIFLHQMVLTEVLLKNAGQDEIDVLPANYNYPLFFDELFPAVRAFNDLSEAVTARYDVYFRNPREGWQDRMTGPEAKIQWLAGRLTALLG